MKKMFFLSAIMISLLAKSQELPETIPEKFLQLYEKSPTEAVNYIFSTNQYFTKDQSTTILKKLNPGRR